MNCFNAFLEPFIRELSDLFVNGIKVDYKYSQELIFEDIIITTTTRFLMRAILAIFTGDNPAQCKFGGWSTTGYSACRNCQMSSRWIPNASPISDNSEDCKSQNIGLMGKMVYDNNR